MIEAAVTIGIVVAGGLISWGAMKYTVKALEEKVNLIDAEIEALKDRVRMIEVNEAVTESQRLDMVKILEENSKDVKAILVKVAELTAMVAQKD